MRSARDDRVAAWLASQPISGLFTTTLTQAEILYGLTLLPEGPRWDDLFAAAHRPRLCGLVHYRCGWVTANLQEPSQAVRKKDARQDQETDG